MKRLLMAATLLSTSPAWALQTPTPGKDDPRVCDVNYNANNVTDIPAVIGNSVAIRFGSTERIIKVTVSDTAHLKRDIIEGSNILYLKADYPMPPQPIVIRTLKEDGTPRDYAIQWSAFSDTEKPTTALASIGDVKIDEVAPEKPKVNFCYLVRYNYPTEVTAAQIAAWRQKRAKEAAETAEIALRKEEESRPRNTHYTGQGDAAIAPVSTAGQPEIYDDGYSTWLSFPGNMRVPTLFRRNPDGTDAEITGTTTEQGGLIKIHGVLPFIRLRDGDLVFCITNRAYSQVGNNPGTGTTTSNIDRSVGGRGE
jgi:type IV secretion system protein VirB9